MDNAPMCHTLMFYEDIPRVGFHWNPMFADRTFRFVLLQSFIPSGVLSRICHKYTSQGALRPFLLRYPV